MTAIKLGCDLNRQVHLGSALWNRAHKIAAQAEKAFTLPARMPSQASTVHALFSGRLERKLFRELVERHQFGLFRNTDGPLALNVKMAANWRNAGAVATHDKPEGG